MTRSFREARIRVLLVEDDQALSDMYRLKLQQDDYEVEVAATGEDALEKVAASPPDLIFLDIRLPRLDGFEVLERLRSEPASRDTPVVLLTNFDTEELRKRGRQLGALEFLVKSHTTPSEVSQRVERWEGHRPSAVRRRRRTRPLPTPA